MANTPTKFSKYCELHGPGTHKVLLTQARKMKSAWNSKVADAKHQAYKAKKDLHAIFNKMVEEHVSNKKHAGDKKRKHENKDNDTKSTNDEIFNIEVVHHKSSLDFNNPNIKCYDYENENTTDDDDDYDPYDDVLGRLVVCNEERVQLWRRTRTTSLAA